MTTTMEENLDIYGVSTNPTSINYPYSGSLNPTGNKEDDGSFINNGQKQPDVSELTTLSNL